VRKLPSSSTPDGYTERFGFDRRTGLVVAGAAAFTVLFAWLPPDGLGIWVFKVLGLLLFGVGGVWFLYMVARGGLAFRADREGVTLGNPRVRQPGMHNRPLRVPWPDVAEVVLFHQYAGQARVPYLGLRLRPGVRRPNTTTFNRRCRLWPVNRGLFPGIPEAVLVRSRPITGWRLDEGRLLEAIAAFAPEVRVLRLEHDGSVRPLEHGR
jgi:hypothetical protein